MCYVSWKMSTITTEYNCLLSMEWLENMVVEIMTVILSVCQKVKPRYVQDKPSLLRRLHLLYILIELFLD